MKHRTVQRCRECGCESPRWLGRCPGCEAWGTIEEAVTADPWTARARPVPVGAVRAEAATARPTGVAELDRVLDGGLVPGSVTLLAGEPGTGKSTLLLQALGRMADAGTRCLLVTAEESAPQVCSRAERLGSLSPELFVVSETALPHVLAHVDAVRPAVLALDSIQTVVDPGAPGVAGSVAQVRDCAYRLVQLAKGQELSTVLVGHVTKEGSVAGPRVLEHLVDTVLTFDGDRGHALRALRARKHRFGSARELGLFEMTHCGLVDVPDASARFLTDRWPGVPGSAVAAVLDGDRPLLVEVQALIVPECVPPRRSAAGVDPARLAMLLAVLDQRCGVGTGRSEVYASVAGGLRVTEPGADLGLAVALGSARCQAPVAPGMVAVGEVGLAGEVRAVAQLEHRLDEAARLGFESALAPPSARPRRDLRVVPVHDVTEALARALG